MTHALSCLDPMWVLLEPIFQEEARSPCSIQDNWSCVLRETVGCSPVRL